MTLYDTIKTRLSSEGWGISPQYTKSGHLMKNAPLVMIKTEAKKKVSLAVTITRRNIVYPSIYRLVRGEIERSDFESIHIREFLARGIRDVFKVTNVKRLK